MNGMYLKVGLFWQSSSLRGIVRCAHLEEVTGGCLRQACSQDHRQARRRLRGIMRGREGESSLGSQVWWLRCPKAWKGRCWIFKAEGPEGLIWQGNKGARHWQTLSTGETREMRGKGGQWGDKQQLKPRLWWSPKRQPVSSSLWAAVYLKHPEKRATLSFSLYTGAENGLWCSRGFR